MKGRRTLEDRNYKNYNFHNVVSKQEKKDAYLLWEQCFKDTKEYMDFYFQNKCEENIILALFEEQEEVSELSVMERSIKSHTITSMLHLNPYTLKFYKDTIFAHYIVGVATRPETRKQGCMAYLMKMALKNMYDKGEIFTYLMPAKEEIYLPFDFRYIYEQTRYYNKIDASTITGRIYSEKLSVKSWSETEKELKQNAVTFVDNHLSEMKDIYVVHSIDYYEKICREMQAAGGEVLLFYRDHILVGVSSYMQEEGKTEIIEAVLDSEYTEEVIGYFEELFAPQEMEITFYDSSFMKKSILENRNYIEKKVPIIMARIVNLLYFLQQIETTAAMYVILQVKDDILLENNKTFLLDFSENGQKKVTVTKEKPHITLDIGTLTSFLLGSTEISQPDSAVAELKKIKRRPILSINEIT